MAIYVVKIGDNVDQIARDTDTPVLEIIYANQLTFPYALTIGQALLIPEETQEGQQSLETNGYAYPFISNEILLETLPYLSELSVFSYGFTVEGELIPPPGEEERLIESSLRTKTRPILVLTPLGQDGRFDNNLIHELLLRPESVEVLIQQLQRTCTDKGYQGVDIDFEYIMAEDRVPFAEFVQKTREELNRFGYQVSVALAPKTSANQPGLLYEGKDYRLLGEAANKVLLMTYEWGYTYSHSAYT